MLLVLDNYDSFTYNLVQYLGELGEQPVVKRNDEITVDDIGTMGVTRMVISPGPCTPTRCRQSWRSRHARRTIRARSTLSGIASIRYGVCNSTPSRSLPRAVR